MISEAKFYIQKTLKIYNKELPHIISDTKDITIIRIPVDVGMYERVKMDIETGVWEKDIRIADVLHNTKYLRKVVESSAQKMNLGQIEYDKSNVIGFVNSDKDIFSQDFYRLVDPDDVTVIDGIERQLITKEDNLIKLVYFDYLIRRINTEVISYIL